MTTDRSDAINYKTLFVTASTPLMMLDSQLRFVTANDCYLGVTAQTLDTLVGRYVFDVFPDTPERIAEVRSWFERALAGEANSQDPHPYAIARPDGGRQDVWWITENQPVGFNSSYPVPATPPLCLMRWKRSKKFLQRTSPFLASASVSNCSPWPPAYPPTNCTTATAASTTP